MEQIRFFNDMLMFAQPIEEAPTGFTDSDDEDFYKEYSLAPYEFNESKINERLAFFNKGHESFEETSDPNTMYFGIPLGWDDFEVESRQKNIEYVDRVTRCLRSINKQFSHVSQAFLHIKETPQYYTVYELRSEDGNNMSCVVCFGYMFWNVESWILPGAKKEKIQYLTRNAPLFKKLFDNFDENVDFSDTQFLVLSTSGSFMNIPVKHNGKLLTEQPRTEQFYEDIFAFVDNVLKQYHQVQYLDMLHTEAKLLNSKEEGRANFFTRDRMKFYMIEVANIKDEVLKDEILSNQTAKRYISRWDVNSEYLEEGEIQEIFKLINTDWEEETSSVTKVFYKYQWDNGCDEISVNFDDLDIKTFFDEFDEYELEHKMPTLYKAYINGLMGRFHEGAIIQTTKITYFRYVYDRKTTKDANEVLTKVDNACIKMLREVAKFVDSVNKKQSKDNTKRTESNYDGILRLLLLHNLF